MQAKSVLLSIKNKISSFDAFGIPISFNYRGSNSFQTFIGGLCTITARILILVFFIEILRQINSYESTITVTTSFIETHSDQRKIQLNESNFDYAIRLENFWVQEENFEEYLNIRFKQIDLYWEGSVFFQEQTELEQEKCKLGRFQGYKYYTYQIENGLNSVCQKNMSLDLYRSFTALETTFPSLELRRCSQAYLDQMFKNKTCKSEEEISQFIQNTSYYFLLMGQFFDTEEFQSDPIKPYGEIMTNALKPDRSSALVYKISQNIAQIQNSWLQSQFGYEERFYYKANSPLSVEGGPDQDLVLSIMLVVDENLTKIKRVRNNLIDGLSETGGIIEIVFFLIELIIHSYQGFTHNAALLKELFLTDKRTASENQVSQLQQSSILFRDQRENFLLLKLNQVISSKTFYMTSFYNFLFAKCICCCSKKYKQQVKLYKRGKKKLFKSLDIITLLKEVRKLKLISKITLQQHHTALIPYFKEYTLRNKGVKNETFMKSFMRPLFLRALKNQAKENLPLDRCVVKLAKRAKENSVDRKIIEDLVEDFETIFADVQKQENVVQPMVNTIDSKENDWDKLMEENKEEEHNKK